MASTSRILVAQIALGAAFGTALAWKTARVRRPGRPSGQPAPSAGLKFAAEMPAPYPAVADRLAEVTSAPRVRQSPAVANAPANASSASHPAPVRTFSAAIAAPFRRLPEPVVFALVIATAALIPVIIGVAYVMTRGGSTPATHQRAVASAPAKALPTAIATPALADQLLDARRELDLGTALDAADAYATLFGAYPSTGGQLATLCASPADAGCAIAKYASNLSVSDGQFPYWYASDGRSVTLLARVQTAPDQDDCPSELPPALAGVPVACLRATIGTQ
ncbi:MAG TPA: hypothetical protein VIE40_00750 [Dehalococcoidia bacterium]|jgi:hypothetical protein